MSSSEIVRSIRRIVDAGSGDPGSSGGQSTSSTTVFSDQTPYGARPDIPGRRAMADSSTSSGGGIASPLTEVIGPDGYALRETYPTQLSTSADGLFVFSIRPIKRMSFLDASGASVDILLAQPKPSPKL
jgi:hypothetical protein